MNDTRGLRITDKAKSNCETNIRTSWNGSKNSNVNYFDRVKRTQRIHRTNLYLGPKEKQEELAKMKTKGNKKKGYTYFDCETFEQYSDPNNPDELPKIIPYLIGVCGDEPGSYTEPFLGVDAGVQFLDGLFDKERKAQILTAFNIDYDFHVIRPFIIDLYSGNVNLGYEMTDEKKFIVGKIRSQPGQRGVNIDFKDLWMGDRRLSLRKYMKNIIKCAFKDDGSPTDDLFGETLAPYIKAGGYDQDTFEKGSIDYVKVNLHEENGKYYYYQSKEDWIHKRNRKELDLEGEKKYLKLDVTSLPIIRLEQDTTKKLIGNKLGIGKYAYDDDTSITSPSYAKYVLEEYSKQYMTETYRMGVSEEYYDLQFKCFTGGFTAGNKNITYYDEEVHKQLYPNIPFYDEHQQGIIKSYDVNSMYPWAMCTGLPVGLIYQYDPGEDSICGYEVQFNSYIDEENEIVYKWKPQYDVFNNSFFGSKFNLDLKPGCKEKNKFFVLDKYYELFIQMCDADVEVAGKLGQKRSHDIEPFIKKLYEIKCDTSYPKCVREGAKLSMNSLFGIMAQQFRLYKLQGVSNGAAFLLNNKHLLYTQDFEVVDHELVKNHRFQEKVSPYFDLDNDCGFVMVQNEKKRYDKNNRECRESITAGIYITQLSRGKLLSSIKGEIDQGNLFLYCDTDSVKMVELHTPKFECHADILGAGKDEGSYTHFGHPNKRKKYFMFNKNYHLRPADKNGKKKGEEGMIKSSGISVSHLGVTVDDKLKFDLETIKTVYNPNNRVLVKNARPNNIRNEGYQVVIRKTDYKFAYENEKLDPTHIMENGILRVNG